MNAVAKNEDLPASLQEKMGKVKEILRDLESVLVAFSGGVDSTLLLFLAHKELGPRAAAIVASSPTYPDFEIAKAKEILRDWGVRFLEVHSHELGLSDFRENSPRRCYHCKKELFRQCREKADELGFRHVADGANDDDRSDYRPGMEAARELGVRSPLMEAGFTKADIREASRLLRLPTWNKPSLACLASRFPYGTEISAARLAQVGRAEDRLRSLGCGQLRVRYHGDLARIEVEKADFPRFLDPEFRREAVRGVKEAGFAYVALDLQGYRSGAMNETLPGREKARSSGR
jgi:pyridinium-3,5-biscarboxylic acid mononucleotide sulfurtransferase